MYIDLLGADVTVTSLGGKTGKIHVDYKNVCCAFGCLNQNAKKILHFYRIPSSKMAFEAKHRCLCLQAIKQTDWTDETCDD